MATNVNTPPQLDFNGINMLGDNPIEYLLHIINLFAIFKVILLVFMVGYLIMATVIMKQIFMMTNTIKNQSNSIIIAFGYLNLIIGILVFLFILFIR